jgi:hypothetical protein
MHPAKTLLLTVVVALFLAVVSSTAQSNSGASKTTSTIEVTDVRGTKHIVTDYGNGSRFFRAGLPFDDISDDYPKNGKGFWDKAKSLKTAIAVELHSPEDQAKIRKAALDRGMSQNVDADHIHTVLLIPLPSIDTITFTQQKAGQDEGQARSVIRLAGGQSFNAGGGFWKIGGKENLGSLGVADFSADFSDIKEIRSTSPPVPFVGDFAFFGSTEVPFSAKVTDTAGEAIVLSKALYCTTGTFSVPDKRNSAFISYGNVELRTVKFRSSLDVKVGGTSSVSIPPSKLRTLRVVRVDNTLGGNANYVAKVILRTGETVDLAIVPSDGIYVPNGILGASPKGWVWIPWFAVASVEFTDN